MSRPMIAITIISSIRLNPRWSLKRLRRVFIYCLGFPPNFFTYALTGSFKSLVAFDLKFKRLDTGKTGLLGRKCTESELIIAGPRFPVTNPPGVVYFM